jgi:putative peptide chain release factor H
MMCPLLLTVSSGLGPVEVRQFVRMLADALEQEVARRGVLIDHVFVHGQASEPSSIDLVVRGDRSVLADLLGTHELVLRSERRGRRSRKRWYAGVTCAEHTHQPAPPLDDRDVTFETCRAGGAGGQHVNKTESAVRAIHRPSGLSVRVESERSQQHNKRRALDALAGMLSAQHIALAAEVHRQRRQRSIHVERGSPVATWHLHNGVLTR